jgi:3-deoxy-D-manno-octulosonate 8-phosphate phosphatase (KDO 8-P phosphatase)
MSETLSALPLSAVDRARRIKIILFDVDGVLTDNGIWLIPVPAAGDNPATAVEAKGFSAHDGTGISLARLAGLQCGFVTKRVSETVKLRARDLKIEYLYMGQSQKRVAVEEIAAKAKVSLDEIAFVGDDIIDLPAMRVAGLAIAVANARVKVKSEAHYITEHAGGKGAGRDAIEFILDAKGILDSTIEGYIDERNEAAVSAADIGKGGM